MRAFVLSGGGARGALQVGALRSLLGAGIQPEMWVGTSIGALNATYLAVRGFSEASLAGLEQAWLDAAEVDLLPANYLWLTIRTLFDRSESGMGRRMRTFYMDQGVSPDLRFGQIEGPPLILVAADLKAGEMVVYGADPQDCVLDGILASTAIPPWVRPLSQRDRLLMDGGVVSNLPIEPALCHGATEIVALDVADSRPVGPAARSFGPFLLQLLSTVEKRQVYLEKRLADTLRVPVHHVRLQGETPVAVWELERAPALFDRGFQLMESYLAGHPELGLRAARRGLPWWRRFVAPRRRRAPTRDAGSRQ